MWITDVFGDEHKLVPGDAVLLNWSGDANVPKKMHMTWARVVDINSHGNLVIASSILSKRTRTIVAKRHVLDVKREG